MVLAHKKVLREASLDLASKPNIIDRKKLNYTIILLCPCHPVASKK
jgi:hypothetical protein